jgi:hypothetical protein
MLKAKCEKTATTLFPGFEPLANQRLLPPTFPRYTEIRSRKSTVEYLSTLVDRILAAIGVVNVTSFHTALVRRITYFLTKNGSAAFVLATLLY